MTIFYLDYENGSDAADGSSWANAWKTITSGPTAARIAPGDIIRIAKSPAPTSIGNATWTDLSKTVELATAQNVTIENCEAAWTANGSGDVTTIAPWGVATDGKEGSYSMRIVFDAAIQTDIMQAYYDIYTHDTTVHDLSAYQKISFWIKNNVAIVADNYYIALCSDIAGATVVDQFLIPAIPSTGQWLPLTLERVGGGNLGNAIKSIAIWTDGTTPTASQIILVDNFIACTTSGLSLQSLISKNSAEQGGTEGWYGIQSINGTTVLLDNSPGTKGNAGEGYSGTTETVTTYKRETIKTALAASSSIQVQVIQDSGTLGNNIEFQGGYDTGTSLQTGETFFDGLNGHGYGIYISSKSYITLNRLNVCQYNFGLYFGNSSKNTITTISNANNNSNGIYFTSSSINTITTISNANNNNNGMNFASSHNNTITTISNANNNTYGINFSSSTRNTIMTLNTTGNGSASIYQTDGSQAYIQSSTLAESTKVSHGSSYSDTKVFFDDYNATGYPHIDCRAGNIVAQAATAGGTGIEWKISPISSERSSYFPLKLELAQVALKANVATTVSVYFKKSHASDIAGSLVCEGNQIAGITDSITTICPDDTNRNLLQLILVPTENGVVNIEAWAWWVFNVADESVIVDSIEIS